jgi:hypothetical protein
MVFRTLRSRLIRRTRSQRAEPSTESAAIEAHDAAAQEDRSSAWTELVSAPATLRARRIDTPEETSPKLDRSER